MIPQEQDNTIPFAENTNDTVQGARADNETLVEKAERKIGDLFSGNLFMKNDYGFNFKQDDFGPYHCV